MKTIKKEVLVNFILDKSGSMETIKDSTISGFNEYIQTLKKDKNNYNFTLTLFDTNIETPFKNKAIKDIKELTRETYNPNGNTSLYDAVCSTIKSVKESKNQKIVTIIMTDGQENSSREYNQTHMKELIKEKESKGNWSFVYLGANQDSYLMAQSFGIPQGNAVNFTASSAGMTRAMNTISTATCSYASASSNSTNAFFASGTTDPNEQQKISQHFSELGKKSWESRKKGLLD
jgi:hypothetical protein